MYRVTLITDGKETLIHNENSSSLKVTDDNLVEGINGIDTYSYALNIDNPGYNNFKPLKTLIKIEDVKKGVSIFDGFVKRYTSSMDSEGIYKRRLTAFQGIAYLTQTKQLYGEYHNKTPKEFLKIMIDEHNRQTEEYKKFYLGEVNVTNSTDNVYRFLDESMTTFDAIHEKLVSRLGGELKARLVNGKWYLDWKVQFGKECSTEIRIGKNLKESERDLDTDNVRTRFFIYGANFEVGIIDRFENSDEGQKAVVEFGDEMRDILKSKLPSQATVGSYILYNEDAIVMGNADSKPYLTIGDVNNGIDYIDDPIGINQFGILVDHIKFEDVNNRTTLKSKGQQYVNSYKQITDSNMVTAVDLALIGKDIDNYEVYNSYPLDNPGIDEKNIVRVIEKRMSLSSPQNASLTIGDKFIKSSQYQARMNKTSKSVEAVKKTVENQNKRLSQVTTTVNGFSVQVKDINTAVANISTQVDQSNLPGLNLAVDELVTAVDLLNQTVGGIIVPGPATETKDGLMTSIDKVKLNGIQKATGTIDGLMIKEDKQKLNRITANQSINLDQFMIDFLALKEQVEGPPIP